MPVQKISLEAVQKIRQYIKGILVLPDSENYPGAGWSNEEELPEPESLDALGDLFNLGAPLGEVSHSPNAEGRWFISALNPGAALAKLPGLKLKAGVRIVSYLWRMGDNGVGVTWSVPEEWGTTFHLEEALESCGGLDQPPQPTAAFADLMEAIEGDASAHSYMIASVLRRELKEFGALGQHCNWSHSRFINAIPPQVNWKWRTQAPKDLSPKMVIAADGKAAIEFFTCRIVAPVTILRHVDQYLPGEYKSTSHDLIVATV